MPRQGQINACSHQCGSGEAQHKTKAAESLAAARVAAAAAGTAAPPSPVKPRDWKPINRISLMKYVAIIIFMGIIGLGSIAEYWGDRTLGHS